MVIKLPVSILGLPVDFTVATLDRSAGGAGVPVVDTYYTVLDTSVPGYMYALATFREDDDANAKRVRFRLTINGTTYTSNTVNQDDDSMYGCFIWCIVVWLILIIRRIFLVYNFCWNVSRFY